MKRVDLSARLHVALTALIALALSACGQTNSAIVDCGEGETRLIGNERYCLYSQELIIEGFSCPSGMSHHDVPGGVVCSPGSSGESLPDVLQEPFEPMMIDPPEVCPDPPCEMTDLDMGSGTSEEGELWQGDMSGIEYPDPARAVGGSMIDEPLPFSTTTFQRVTRSEGLACVVTEDDVGVCWGRWSRADGRSGVLPNYPGERGVGEIVAGTDRVCMRRAAAADGTTCWRYDEQGAWVIAEGILPGVSSLSMHHEGGREALVCGRDGSGALQCADVTEETALRGDLEGLGYLPSKRVDHFRIDAVARQTSDLSCAVIPGGQVECLASRPATIALTFTPQPGESPFEEVYVSERGGEAVVMARRQSGELSAWVRAQGDLQALTAPSGAFIELYSALCGLRDEEVLCWDRVASEGKRGEPTTSVLYPEHPRSLQIAAPSGPNDTARHFCAISLDGELTCSSF